jgi:hypothetical protein
MRTCLYASINGLKNRKRERERERERARESVRRGGEGEERKEKQLSSGEPSDENKAMKLWSFEIE